MLPLVGIKETCVQTCFKSLKGCRVNLANGLILVFKLKIRKQTITYVSWKFSLAGGAFHVTYPLAFLPNSFLKA